MASFWNKLFGDKANKAHEQRELNHQLEKQRMQKEAENSSIMYTNMLTGLVDAVIIIDTQNIVTLFNPAAENLWGYSAKKC